MGIIIRNGFRILVSMSLCHAPLSKEMKESCLPRGLFLHGIRPAAYNWGRWPTDSQGLCFVPRGKQFSGKHSYVLHIW